MSVWPQFTYLALILFGLGVTCAKHGEAQKPHNIFTSLISVSICLTLLYFGGFFAPLLEGNY